MVLAKINVCAHSYYIVVYQNLIYRLDFSFEHNRMYTCFLYHLRSWVSSSRCVGKPSSGVLLLAVPVLVMSSDRCSLDMLKASPDWTLRHSSFKAALVLVSSALELAGGSLVVLFFLVVLLPPPDDDDDLRLLAGAE